MKIWLDGKLVDREDAKISVYDHGLLYGDGVFEGIRLYHGRIFECQAHIDRLFESARQIRLTIPYTKQELADAMGETIRANNRTDGYIRLVVTRGVGNLGVSPFTCPRPSVFIIADEIAMYPREMYEQGMAVIIASTVRTAARMVSPAVKSLNYLNNVLAKIEAVDAGVGEAIMLNEDGNVAECTGDNIFIVTDGTLVTPPPEAGILLGITRAVVLRLAEQMGIPAVEQNLKPAELYAAHECFLTGTAAEVIPVTKINDKTIGQGKVGEITRRIHKAFHELVRKAPA